MNKFGPGLLVTAAFIGPGTITTASKAGAGFGFALLWTVLFATAATIVFQEMSARLGLVTRRGLGEAIQTTFEQKVIRLACCGLVAAAIGFGNAAYETGNITGAAIGLSVLSDISVQTWSIILGGVAFALLLIGRYKLIERVLVVLVIMMSLTFLVTATMLRPDFGQLLKGALVPTLPDGSLLTVIGLIGTTVVPYNLFLHASSVQEKWPTTVPKPQALREARVDTSIAVALGGLITLAVISTAAAAFYERGEMTSPAEMAKQLEPLLGGPAAKILFAFGLVSAGLTSAITAPLAAAFAICGSFGWPIDLKSWRFRAIWILVLTTGTLVAASGTKSPASTILIAQAANGLLLPLIAVFLLFAVNRRDLMGEYKNGWRGNLAGGIVVLVATGLGIHTLVTRVFGG
ncbi:MAG TPA: Nramp family divalent metal transporter [Pirellulaceae bacterium]|nr:Nramp family divalent metal transporter [Pirellulaceae bacterium]